MRGCSKVKPEEIRNLSDEELGKKVEELRQEIFNLRVQLATQRTTNVARVSAVKKDLSRALTIIREKELQKSGETSHG